MLEGAVFNQELLVLFLALLPSQHLEKLFWVLEVFLGLLLDGAAEFVMVEAHIALPEAIQEAGERVGETVAFGPDLLKVVLQVLEFFGLEPIEYFLLLLLLVLVQGDFFLEGVLGIFDQDGL